MIRKQESYVYEIVDQMAKKNGNGDGRQRTLRSGFVFFSNRRIWTKREKDRLLEKILFTENI